MPESNTLPRTEAESKPDPESSTETEYVERTDVGVSLTVKLTRSIDTRDQDTIRAKMKATTLEEAREDMETLRAYVSDLAADVRQIQPAPPRKNVACHRPPSRFKRRFRGVWFSAIKEHEVLSPDLHPRDCSVLFHCPEFATHSRFRPRSLCRDIGLLHPPPVLNQ